MASQRAPRRRDQPRINQLFEYVREPTDESGLLNHRDPPRLPLRSIDPDQEHQRDNHEKRLEPPDRRLVEQSDTNCFDGKPDGVTQ